MRQIFHVWTARRAAVATIAPLIRVSTRLRGPVPEHAWGDPYLIGFLTMLISLIALARTSARLDSDALGVVQMRAWRTITGLPDDRIGEELLLLSAANNEHFKAGCRNARTFFAALTGIEVSDVDRSEPKSWHVETWLTLSPDELSVFGRNGQISHSQWVDFFDEHAWT